MPLDPDALVREAAFRQLDLLVARHGPVLPWAPIAEGFQAGGVRHLFASIPRGIFRPSGMQGGALSLKTVFTPKDRVPRYDDQRTPEGYFLYRLQGADADTYDNQWLRLAHELRAPMIYFLGIEKGLYHPIYPVHVAAVHAGALACEIFVGERGDRTDAPIDYAEEASWEGHRRYATVLARRRLHQVQFRHHVVKAYGARCAICRLPRPELLDAAHIRPDLAQGSTVEVPNGLSLCQLHHRAFDRDLLGIRPDGVVQLSRELLGTQDGPTFEEAFRRMHGAQLSVPRRVGDRPRREYLEERWEQFCEATQ